MSCSIFTVTINWDHPLQLFSTPSFGGPCADIREEIHRKATSGRAVFGTIGCRHLSKLTTLSQELSEQKAKGLTRLIWEPFVTLRIRAIVLAYLTVPPRNDRGGAEREVWAVRFEDEIGNQGIVQVDLPQRAYSFHALVLPAAFVTKYKALTSLPVTSGKGSGTLLTNFGSEWYRLANEEDYVKIKDQRGSIGWVHLPEIGSHRSEIVDFVGGLLRMFRGDWEGAIELFSSVTANTRTPTNLQIDSYLLLIRAKTELGIDPMSDIEAVEKLGPGSRTVAQYIAMHYISRCYAKRMSRRISTTPRVTCRSTDREALSQLVARSAPLFSSDDPWFTTVAGLSDRRTR